MDLLTIHFITLILQPTQLITLILQPTRDSVSGFITGHICVPAGGGEDGVASAAGDDCRRRKRRGLLAKFATIRGWRQLPFAHRVFSSVQGNALLIAA